MNNNATKTRQRHSRQQWQGTLERWQISGLLPADFCRDHAISLASFYQWRLKLQGKVNAAKTNPAAVFAEYRQSELATNCPLKLSVTWDSVRGIQIRITGDWAWSSFRGEHDAL